jgi:hypothetical protein
MKLTADTPADGDFVRYLAELERSSPTYQHVSASLRQASIGEVPRRRLFVAPVALSPRGDGGEPAQPRSPLQASAKASSLKDAFKPLLQRLERALAQAARRP